MDENNESINMLMGLVFPIQYRTARYAVVAVPSNKTIRLDVVMTEPGTTFGSAAASNISIDDAKDLIGRLQLAIAELEE